MENSLNIKFKIDVIKGLKSNNKSIPCKYLYDKKGSKLFDEITLLKEYYPTKTEINILNNNVNDIKKLIGKNLTVFEFGAGSVKKIRILLDNLSINEYFPIDISLEYLNYYTKKLSNDYPNILIKPLFGDFTKNIDYPNNHIKDNNFGFFPGSTIGNFEPKNAKNILINFGKFLGSKSNLLIGIDLRKNEEILLEAYNDKKNITAQFNLNLLTRINNELNGNFDISKFKHLAIYNNSLHRIEMHIISLINQNVAIDNEKIFFKKNESIHTENSYKYSIDSFQEIAKESGFVTENFWVDSNKFFGLFLLKYTN